MIGNGLHIKKFSPVQKALVQSVATLFGLKKANDVFFFVLDKVIDQQQEINRLKRLLEIKKKEIKTLKGETE